MSSEAVKEGLPTATVLPGQCLEIVVKAVSSNYIFGHKFSDILIYASRSASVQFQFKVHGHLPLHNIMVEETEPKLGVNYCFTIYSGERALMVAAKYDLHCYTLPDLRHCPGLSRPDNFTFAIFYFSPFIEGNSLYLLKK